MKRLGKSPSDVTPHAPTGATNAAFDLAASVIDPDGPPDGGGGGILPPTGVELKWTERLIGDYNLDGQVNVQDLAPLGINWERTVAYDAPALHGGIAYWPTGGPLDDGGSVYPDPPATTSGAANWRRARVDGKEDGILNAQDVTPIAVHWGEQSTGYRVYAKLPGETAFHVLPNPDDGASPLTIPRSKTFPVGHTQADPTRPVSINFTYGDSVTALPDGRYEFYTAAYDAATDADGPASAHVAMDITGGNVNQFPVAKLSLDPDFAGAPAVVTFDASLSNDPDGSIVEYQWDFDGNGTVDWSTTDAVPDSVCNGEVDTITPGAGTPPTTVTVTFHKYHANFFYPHVTVVDDQGAKAAGSAKLGISGWTTECLNYSETDYKILFTPVVMSIDPATREIVAAGRCMTDEVNNILPTGTYFGRRHSDGTWETQLLPVPNDGVRVGGLMTTVTAKDIEWDEHGQPIVLLMHHMSGFGGGVRNAIWTAQPDAEGQWECVERYFASLPADQAYGSYCGDLMPYASGKFAGIVSETLYDKQNLKGYDWHLRTYMLKYDHSAWSVEYTGYDDAERPEKAYLTVSPQPGIVYALFADDAPHLFGVWRAQWNEGTGLGEPEQIPSTTWMNLSECGILGTALSSNGSMFVLYDGTNNRKLARIKPGGTADWFNVIADKPWYATNTPWVQGLHAIDNGAAMFARYGADFGPPIGSVEVGEHWRWEGDNWIHEETLPAKLNRTINYSCSTTDTANGQEYLIVNRYYYAPDDWPRLFNEEVLYFCTRVDPRLSP